MWKEPAFFLAHPAAIAAFGRECTRRGVPPPTVKLFGSPFLTWRGLPLVPSRQAPLEGGKTEILLHAHRREEARRGRPVPAWHSRRGQPEPLGPLHGHQPAGRGLVSRLALLIAAVLTEDALGVLESAEVGKFHEYSHSYATSEHARAGRSRAK